MRLGERLELEGVAPHDGFIHLFDLGTSGFCQRLWPSSEYPKNFVKGEELFCFPSVRFLRDPRDEPILLDVRPPVSTNGGDKERFLAIVTTQQEDIDVEDLHPELWELTDKEKILSAEASSPEIRISRPRLFQLEKSTWEYGLLELKVSVSSDSES